jgi:hypothetical protein
LGACLFAQKGGQCAPSLAGFFRFTILGHI